jgi:hypothetical protein
MVSFDAAEHVEVHGIGPREMSGYDQRCFATNCAAHLAVRPSAAPNPGRNTRLVVLSDNLTIHL